MFISVFLLIFLRFVALKTQTNRSFIFLIIIELYQMLCDVFSSVASIALPWFAAILVTFYIVVGRRFDFRHFAIHVLIA